MTQATAELESLNRAAGLEIDECTGTSKWLGEAMDHGLAVEGLLVREGLLEFP